MNENINSISAFQTSNTLFSKHDFSLCQCDDSKCFLTFFDVFFNSFVGKYKNQI